MNGGNASVQWMHDWAMGGSVGDGTGRTARAFARHQPARIEASEHQELMWVWLIVDVSVHVGPGLDRLVSGTDRQ
jgi:hypothetical protein